MESEEWYVEGKGRENSCNYNLKNKLEKNLKGQKISVCISESCHNYYSVRKYINTIVLSIPS